jgi:hypothetical protein
VSGDRAGPADGLHANGRVNILRTKNHNLDVLMQTHWKFVSPTIRQACKAGTVDVLTYSPHADAAMVSSPCGTDIELMRSCG